MCVVRVDCHQTPELTSFAQRAQELANDLAPKITKLLGEKKFPHFKIVFKQNTAWGSDGLVPAYARGHTIYLSADWLSKYPDDFEMNLAHEMTHVIQGYSAKAPSCWTEGIATYVGFKLGYTNTLNCAECSASLPHYTSGYNCAGALLLYIEAAHGSALVRQLHTKLQQGLYSDSFFAEATGKSLEQLWTDFKQTPPFTSAAAHRLELEAWLKSPGKKSVAETMARMAEFLRTQPGGAFTADAQMFLIDLANKDCLPGFAGTGPAGLAFERDDLNAPVDFPISRIIHFLKKDDRFRYHYTVVKESPQSAWKLSKSWRTNPDGRILAIVQK